jgi:hypothetical protein
MNGTPGIEGEQLARWAGNPVEKSSVVRLQYQGCALSWAT